MKKVSLVFVIFVLWGCGKTLSPQEQLQENMQGFWVGSFPQTSLIKAMYQAEFVGQKMLLTRMTMDIDAGQLIESKSVFDYEPIDETRFQINQTSVLSVPIVVELKNDLKEFTIENHTEEFLKIILQKLNGPRLFSDTLSFKKA